MEKTKELQETLAPEEMEVEFRFRSAPLVPALPVITVADPLVKRAKYPAVPVFPAVPAVIELAVAVTLPPLATAVANAVGLKVRVTSRVPDKEPFNAGCAPV